MKTNTNKYFLLVFLIVMFVAVNFLNKQGNVSQQSEVSTLQYHFKNDETWESHFEKHGGEFGYATKEEYLIGANRVIEDPNALFKTEAEDGDFIYYLEADNEIVFVSTKGIIRSYFRPQRGIEYFNKQ